VILYYSGYRNSALAVELWQWLFFWQEVAVAVRYRNSAAAAVELPVTLFLQEVLSGRSLVQMAHRVRVGHPLWRLLVSVVCRV
jgi:hypothetical protein